MTAFGRDLPASWRRALESIIVGALFTWTNAWADKEVSYWNVDKLASIAAQNIVLSSSHGKNLGTVTRDHLLVLKEVRTRIEKSSGVKSDFYIVTGDEPNAFATNVTTGRNLFAINLPMLNELGDDFDALAVLMGHEFAHIVRNHIKQKLEEAKEVQKGAEIANILLSAAGVRLSGFISNLGANWAFGSFSRDQEREADNFGLQYAKNAGFNPYGGVRLFSKIMEKHGNKWGTFLALHPSHSERIQSLRDQITRDHQADGMQEAQVTSIPISDAMHVESDAIALGEDVPIVFDSEERVPTLHQKIRCRMLDGSESLTTRVGCVQQEGLILK